MKLYDILTPLKIFPLKVYLIEIICLEYQINLAEFLYLVILRGSIYLYLYVSGPISLSTTNAEPSFEILRNLSISASVSLLSGFERNDTLVYTYTLQFNSTPESLTTTSDDSIIFNSAFTCDTCYRVSYFVENCVDGNGTLYSNYFILPGIYHS